MRPNVKQFVEMLSRATALPSPVLDVGSMHTEGQEAYADLRPCFPGATYTGLDMRPGPGVQALGSAHHLPARAASVGTVLVLDTLEHVLDPIAAMGEVCRAVRPGGIVIASSHMNFPVHAHPSDYWRFTPMAFDMLLRPLATRFVFMQGDAENPGTVLGVGMKDAGDGAAEVAFRAAVHRVQLEWPERSDGGPLVLHQPLVVDVSQRESDRILPPLTPGRVIEQSFRCTMDGLSRIDVRMANPRGSKLPHVVFRLFEDGHRQEPIATYRILAWHIMDAMWVAFPVPSQARSAGKRYVLTVESPDAPETDGLGVRASDAPTDIVGELRIDQVAEPATVAFQTYCWAPPAIATGDVQAAEDVGRRALPEGAAPHAMDARLAALQHDQWQQAATIIAEVRAELDAIRDRARRDHAALEALQQRTLDASTETLLNRALRENPATRALRKLRRRAPEDDARS